MLKILEGCPPLTLTLYASMDEVDRLTSATLQAAAPARGGAANRGAIADGIDRLEAVRPRLHYRVTELCAAILAALHMAQQPPDPAKPREEQYAEFRQRVLAVGEVERRMYSDSGLMEELRH